MSKNKNVSKYVGDVLLLLSLFVFLYLFWPVIQIYLFPPTIQKNLPDTGTYITIPKIHAQSPVILNVDPANQTIYDEALKHGVAQAKGTSLPGKPGTVYLFAHSSGPIWDETHFNTIFMRLGELKRGDVIIIRTNGKNYVYKMRESKIVKSSEVGYLTNTHKTQLIVQTCWPIGTSFYRLLVFADLQS